MVLSIEERIQGFLFRPSATFDASKEDTIGDAFKYFVVLLAIYAVLFSIMVYYVAFSAMSWIVGPGAAIMGLAAGHIRAVAMLVLTFISGIIAVFIAGLCMHIGVYIVGGRKGVKQTIKALMYGSTPSCLLGWIPFVGIIAGIWALVVKIIGIRQLHELSTGKVGLAFILAIIIPGIVAAIVVFAALIIITIPELIPELGPGFGGY